MISSAVSTGCDGVDRHGGRSPGDLELLVETRIADEDLEHEAVLLGLGQRIGAFLLDGVLRGQDEERIGQLDAAPGRR